MEICVIRGYGERNPHQVCGGTETTKVSFELLRRNLLLEVKKKLHLTEGKITLEKNVEENGVAYRKYLSDRFSIL